MPWTALGNWPTPLDEVHALGHPLWVKREGASSPLYGGNKVRTLEPWFGLARARGARRIWAIGAYGSNHAIATVLHARALGLDAGAIVFPQPHSAWAAENAGALIATGCPIIRLRNVVEVPFAGGVIAARERDAVVMPPGGATPIGALGAVSATLELAEQIAAGRAPPPRAIVLAVGSTCTAAGLLAGLALARAVGTWRWPVPAVHAVRVTPWPITSRVVITQLAALTLARIAKLGGPDVPLGAPRLVVDLRELAASARLGIDPRDSPGARRAADHDSPSARGADGRDVRRLVIDRRELGAGYGRVTPRGRAALDSCTEGWPRLDGVYSAKATAALLRLHAAGVEPLVLWATKSEVELAPPSREALSSAPPVLVRWLARGRT